ncbi:hypothetical protein NRS6187_12930 [Bacillus subtilis]|nr:hypothetical protein NRS6099_00568 [Bacillus subtilis]CAF1784601.1 hypothetical protein NRS6105_03930 [Bacillus subtilis]CAF1795959.1 hypothetical protein NRS6132_00697 [Bacillus subtilis]CAF1819748.1 hypothetical protein NRS6145_01594 [Bacillus subtilis]CAF1876396.1 hypothetical protein NRS6183_02008 [Bacillus subtilis]
MSFDILHKFEQSRIPHGMKYGEPEATIVS